MHRSFLWLHIFSLIGVLALENLHFYKSFSWLPVAQGLKRLPSMRETWVPSLGREDSLEKEMATHSSILAWRIPWTVELVGYSPWVAKSRTQLSDFTFTFTWVDLAEEDYTVWETELFKMRWCYHHHLNRRVNFFLIYLHNI